MFSSGNITEKLRLAKFDCSGEVVVDLYAGRYNFLKLEIYTFIFIHIHSINPLTNANILDVTKLKAFADDKFNITKVMSSLFDRIKNIEGVLFLRFQKASSSGL